ncbi:hypothetical protein [Bacillus wiedmannii]|uniref:hypothetical protein n=1 Tax=Bacillus wiedmannii TaxID=1890302 RepID=UPI0021D1DA06|nr:hypothetical protein [Bacillus wiedmannii]MCU5596214.1 hypothetical protein [Bacillus wiedmannii]
MIHYQCKVCEQFIHPDQYKNGLAVIIRNGHEFVKGIVVHKNACDDKLAAFALALGLNTNSSLELSSLGNKEMINQYLRTGK